MRPDSVAPCTRCSLGYSPQSRVPRRPLDSSCSCLTCLSPLSSGLWPGLSLLQELALGPPVAHRWTVHTSVVAWSVLVHRISLPPRLAVFAFRSLHTWACCIFLSLTPPGVSAEGGVLETTPRHSCEYRLSLGLCEDGREQSQACCEFWPRTPLCWSAGLSGHASGRAGVAAHLRRGSSGADGLGSRPDHSLACDLGRVIPLQSTSDADDTGWHTPLPSCRRSGRSGLWTWGRRGGRRPRWGLCLTEPGFGLKERAAQKR